MNEQQKILIAIADDHTLLRKGLADLIDSFGPFKVIIETEDGSELIAQLHATTTLPHICILDINMPKMDGFATLTVIREKWPGIKTLALSMYNNEFTIIRMLRNGANGYLLKNCNPGEFKNALTAIHNKGFYESGYPVNEPAVITPKELEFLAYCCSELAYKEIADKMGISPRTVEDHRDNLFKKLKMNTRIGLVMYAINAGIVHLDR